MPESEPSYVALKSCGCMVACIVDDPKDYARTAKELAKWQRSGLRIKRVEAKEIRNGTYEFCKCGRRKQAPLFTEAPNA